MSYCELVSFTEQDNSMNRTKKVQYMAGLWKEGENRDWRVLQNSVLRAIIQRVM